MEVTINKGCKTAKGIDGNTYEIKGLVVRKDNGKDAFYDVTSKMCQAVMFKGFKERAIKVSDTEIHLF